jgi:hypothetical protein
VKSGSFAIAFHKITYTNLQYLKRITNFWGYMNATKTLLIKILPIILLFLLSSIPAYAASYTITSLNGLRGDCSSYLVLEINVDMVATSNDFIQSDLFGHVLRDASGKAVAKGATSLDLVDSPASGIGVIHLDWISGSNLVLPLTLRTYDIPYTAFQTIADLEAGPLLNTLQFDPKDYGFICVNDDDTVVPEPSSPEVPEPAFKDGRFNDWDTGSPIVVFPHETESGQGLVVYSPEGVLLLVITAEEIAALPECPETNTLIASENNVSFYRLTDCSYQFNAPSVDGTKTYVLILFGLNADSGYRSYEE